MTYLMLTLWFVGAALLVALLLRPRGAIRLTAAAIALLVVLALTAIFDNVMIASGLFHYSPEHLTGFRLGLAPIEDFAYPLAGVLLLPALWWALRRRRSAAPLESRSAAASEREHEQ